MKFTWGTGIAVFMTLFILFILSFIYRAASLNTELYAEDYYQQEIDYQNTIDAKQNAKAIKEDVYISQGNQSIVIHFPKHIEVADGMGKVEFYRPSDTSKDRVFALNLKNGIMQIAKDGFVGGNYKVKLSWTVNDSSFLVTKDLFIE